MDMLKFSKMSKYDMTGIGLNLREIPDDNGSFKLMVLGLLLDGPTYSVGVRQVSTIHIHILIETLSAL
jgi:carboxyl-terminal processing protease